MHRYARAVTVSHRDHVDVHVYAQNVLLEQHLCLSYAYERCVRSRSKGQSQSHLEVQPCPPMASQLYWSLASQ